MKILYHMPIRLSIYPRLDEFNRLLNVALANGQSTDSLRSGSSRFLNLSAEIPILAAKNSEK